MDGAFYGRSDVLRRRGSARHSFHSHVARGIQIIFPQVTFHFLFMILQYRFPSLFSLVYVYQINLQPRIPKPITLVSQSGVNLS